MEFNYDDLKSELFDEEPENEETVPAEDFAEEPAPAGDFAEEAEVWPEDAEEEPAEIDETDAGEYESAEEPYGPEEEPYAEPVKAPKKNRKTPWGLIVAGVIVLVLAAAVLVCGMLVQKVETIYPGVQAEGLDLSEKTADEAAELLTKLGHERYDYFDVDVNLPLDNSLTVTTDDVGMTFSVHDAVSKAWHYGRDEGFFGNMLTYAKCKLLGKTENTDDMKLTVTLDEGKLKGLIHDTAVDIDEQLLENAVVIKEDTLELIKGASGLTIDEEELYRMVSTAFLTGESETLTYESEPDLDEEFDFQALYDENYAVKVEAQLAYNPACLEAKEEEELDPELAAKAEAAAAAEAAVAAANAGENTTTVDEAAAAEAESFVEQCYALGATITDWEEGEKYRILPSTTGWSFDVAEAERLWAGAGYGETVVIPLNVDKPELSTEDLTSMIFGDVLTKNWTMYRFGYTDGYTEDIRTSLSGSTNYRISNVKKACDLINDTILLPGETFSYNAALGQRTEEAGWLPAPAYANGEVRQEPGGGICQVSSTLYNAALYANLEIVERNCHQFKVAYLPWGLDATVSWGWPDFKFKNDKEYPIIIKAWVDEDTNQCCFQIFGTDTDHVYVLMKFNNWYFYDTTGEYVDKEGNALSIGMEAATWRLVFHDGDDYNTAVPISNEYEAHSKYNDHTEDIEARMG